ncbi:MAG: polyphosphate kinase, partial [Pseudomonadota bacterium]|nr:polyphosphate kinase [Pseudomonadota bacterium]
MSKPKNTEILSSSPVLFEDFGQSRFASKEEYKDALVQQQEKLFDVQQSYFHQKKRALIVFEGWDAS